MLRLANLVFLTAGTDCFRLRAVAPEGRIFPSGNRPVVLRAIVCLNVSRIDTERMELC